MIPLFDSNRLHSKAIDSRKSKAIESNRWQSGNACFAGRCRRLWWLSIAIAFTAFAARGDYQVLDIASREAVADFTRFESREWA